MQFLDTIKLGFNNNLILGNDPEKLSLDRISEKNLKDADHLDIQSFGLFDSNQANYNTYYPDVTAEDLAPKDNEFVYPVFRALSEVIVHKDWNPVDFSMNGVLKKSMSLLNGATVNADHETTIGNALGAVAGVYWEESYKSKGGIVIPAGINAKTKLDGKSHPRVARAVMMDPPSIHSTSVTVRFLWEKSHPDLSQDEFFNKLGTYDKQQKLIRRIATDIKNYPELSLVGHGADPFAQKVGADGIVNPKWADTAYNSMSGAEKKKQNVFFFDFKTDVISNSIPKESINNNNTKDEVMNKTFLLALAAVMGVKLTIADDAEPTAEDIKLVEDKVAELVNLNSASQTTLGERDTEIIRLQAIESTYNNEKATFAEAVGLKAFRDAQVISLRAHVTATFKALKGDKADAVMLKVIEDASYETLTALQKQYTEQLEEKFPISCKSCGSQEVNRASAAQKVDEATNTSSMKDKLKARAQKGVKSFNIHEEVTPAK